MRNNAIKKREKYVISQLYEIAKLREKMKLGKVFIREEVAQMRRQCDENLNPLMVWDKALKALESDLDG